jgi:hypothetical protein
MSELTASKVTEVPAGTVTGTPGTTWPVEVVVEGVNWVVSFWISTTWRLPEKVLLINERCCTLLAGVLEVPFPPQDVIRRRPKTAGRTANHFKRFTPYIMLIGDELLKTVEL